ncbi:MAG: hypothetical protein AAGA76_02220 [Pseudomonadota bacterium]
MQYSALLNREFSASAALLAVSAIACFALAIFDYSHDFTRFWDFQVYLKAKEHLAVTGSPYYEADSLRFIYPPSSLFMLNLITESEWFKSVYFILGGTLWLATAAIFCRRPLHLLIVFPVLLMAFGKHGYITMLTGNIACILYFVAAISAWLYFTGRISILVFSVLILALTLIKPFYAEFMIFIWFVRGLRIFIAASIAVIALFFAINLLLYPQLFAEFLDALKFQTHDTEIFGVTLMSHLNALGLATPAAAFFHFTLIGLFFLAFLGSLQTMSRLQIFCCLFTLAVFINPKHISYDLMVALPALSVVLLESRIWNYPCSFIV